MARRIKKNNIALRCLHFVGTQMLRNTAFFTGSNTRFANKIKQRCFAMINMTDNNNDGWPRLKFTFTGRNILKRIG